MSAINWKSIRHLVWDDARYDEVKEYILHDIYPKNVDTPQKKFKWRKHYNIFSLDDTDQIVLLLKNSKDIPWVNDKEGKSLGINIHLPHKMVVVKENQVKMYLSDLFKSPIYNGHRAVDSFYSKLSKNYIGISKEMVREFMKHNEIKQLSRPTEMKVLKPILTTNNFEMLVIDLIDMSAYAKSNKHVTFILNVIDHFSKFAFSRPLKNKSAILVAAEMQNIILQYGVPKIILADNGGEFTSLEMKALCERFNIELRHGLPYQPKTQGAIERFNKTIKEGILAQMTQNNNNKYLDSLQSLVYAYNSQKHSTTNFTPFQVLFRRDQAIDTLTRLVKGNIEKKADKMVADSIKKSKSTSEPLYIGDKVRVDNQVFKSTRKLNNKYGKKSKLYWSKTIYTVAKQRLDEDSGQLQYSLWTEKDTTLLTDGDKVLWLYRHQLQKINIDKLDSIGKEELEDDELKEEYDRVAEESYGESKRADRLNNIAFNDHDLSLGENGRVASKIRQEELDKKEEKKEQKEIIDLIEEEEEKTGLHIHSEQKELSNVLIDSDSDPDDVEQMWVAPDVDPVTRKDILPDTRRSRGVTPARFLA